MRIALLDDHGLLTELIKNALQKLDLGYEIFVYNKPSEFLNLLLVDNTDLLITDIMMPEMNGLKLIAECRKIKKNSELAIIVLSSMTDSNTIKEAIKIGANCYLAKNTSINELVMAINSLVNNINKAYIGKSLIESFIQSNFNFDEIKLSPRESTLLLLICEGNTIKEIASYENLSINTIQSYMKKLMKKMNVNRTPDLILKAIKIGLFQPNKDF